jgi:hypothetical protein
VTDKKGTAGFLVYFKKCLWKVKDNPANVNTDGIFPNQPPLFDSINNQQMIYNFRLKENSPALHAGNPTALTSDLDGKPRNVGAGPDLGSYEKQD